MPHERLVAYVFTKLFCWGVTGCSCSVQFGQAGSENWSPAGHGHTPLRFHFATMRSSTVLFMLSTVTSFCFPSACAINGASSVSRVCSDVIFAGCTSAVVIGSTVGVTRVQKAHASEFYVHVRWKPVGLSDVYWNYNMIEQVKGNWEFNLRDHVFAFPGI